MIFRELQMLIYRAGAEGSEEEEDDEGEEVRRFKP